MTDNTALWDKLGKTDPAHTKPFKRSGGFTGTAIKPMWSYRRMTEEFGPCGKGWGVNEPSFQVVPTGDTVLVFCTASVWYENPDQIVFGVGGDMAAGKRGQHSMVDDEAFKKAFTDAVTNALKLIGVGADVHMGMFDDNKYVNTMKKEFSEDHKDQDAKNESAVKVDNQVMQTFEALKADMRKCKTKDDLGRWWRDEECKTLRAKLPANLQADLKAQLVQLGDAAPSDSIANETGRELHPLEAAE